MARTRATAARFEAFIAPARRRPELWRLGAGMVLAVAIWTAAAVALGAAVQGGGARASILAYLLSFAGLAAGLGLAVRVLHGRSFASLFGPGGFRPRGFLAGAVVVAVVIGVTALPALALGGPSRRMALGVWLAWLPLALPALMVQVSAEELVFRGYLQQQLAARFERRLVWLVLPAALFGALHFDPSLGPDGALVAGVAGVTGLVYGDVVARTGNLSVAIGLHFVNNAFALLVVATDMPLGAFSLYVSPLGPEDGAALRAALGVNLGLTLAVWGLWRAVLARRARTLHSRDSGSI